jgi:DNA-3-methyladenine glycosylase II
MGLTAAQLKHSLDSLAAIEPGFAAGLARHGYPDPRIRERGYMTLLRTIVGQQVSVHAADAVWRRMQEAFGADLPVDRLVVTSDEDFRSAGLSRQKSGYVRSLAELVSTNALDLTALPEDDEEAIAALVRIKGIGRWSAEIYLLFAEGRQDIWPAGDLAVQEEVGQLLGHDVRPSEKLVRELAEAWRPHRGAAAIFTWHHYGRRLAQKGSDKAPV